MPDTVYPTLREKVLAFLRRMDRRFEEEQRAEQERSEQSSYGVRSTGMRAGS